MAYQVFYSSQAVAPLPLDELEKILVDARVGNEKRGVTGALIYVDGVFLQILEGPEATVKSLMHSIAQDSRHSSMHVFHEAEVDQALFSTWKMAYLHPTPAQVASWLGLQGTATIEDVLADVHRGSDQASRIAYGILKAIAQ